jgi:uroporphyrin-III C-methyltransferase/precorrin-2 dehydrogenase/sirohydrochlorin ferrochelatase
MGYYAAFLDLTGRRCLVVGGGEPALAKVRGLLDAGARVTVVWDHVIPALRALGVSLLERRFEESDADGCAVVIDASCDEGTGTRVSQAARARGILVNVLDRPARCTFIAPALIRRGPLQVAISTSGRSPFLASHLRRRIEGWLGPEWEAMVELTGRLRDRLRQRGVPLRVQTEAYGRALVSGALEHLRAGEPNAAERAVHASAAAGPGWIALVGAGPGDPGLLTVRATELLARADVVFYDALVEPGVLAWCRAGAELVPVGKRGGRKSVAQAEIETWMIRAARAGRFVVRLKGGDPFVFGRGGEEVLAAAHAGIRVEVVPGISSALAAPALAGIPLTHRGVAASFAVTTARRGDGTLHDFRDLAGVDTLVVMMPTGSLELVTAQLIAAGRSSRCPAAMVEAASTPRQRVVRGVLVDIGERARRIRIEGPALLVVGEVVAVLPANAFEQQPTHGLDAARSTAPPALQPVGDGTPPPHVEAAPTLCSVKSSQRPPLPVQENQAEPEEPRRTYEEAGGNGQGSAVIGVPAEEFIRRARDGAPPWLPD